MASMLNAMAAKVLTGAHVETVRTAGGWNVHCNGEVLVGIAGGAFAFASAANARDWVVNAVERYMAGNQKSLKVDKYIARLEVLRLKAELSGKSELAQWLGDEIGALSSLSYDVPLCGGGGAQLGGYIFGDGGGAQ